MNHTRIALDVDSRKHEWRPSMFNYVKASIVIAIGTGAGALISYAIFLTFLY